MVNIAFGVHLAEKIMKIFNRLFLQTETSSADNEPKTGGSSRSRRPDMFAWDSGADADAEMTSESPSESSTESRDTESQEQVEYYD